MDTLLDTELDTELDTASREKNNPRSGMIVARVCPIVYHVRALRQRL
jgi:hypothetical protein